MQAAIEQFRVNISRAKNLNAICVSVQAMTTSAIDLSDLFRAQIVLSVSALDQYVHEVTRMGMLETFHGTRMATDQFLKFQVPIGGVLATPNHVWFDEQVRVRHSYSSFQQPDKIADAVRLVSSIKLWQKVGDILGKDADDVKKQLELIIDRRNKIAHEADINPVYPTIRWPINATMANDSSDFIAIVCETIHSLVL